MIYIHYSGFRGTNKVDLNLTGNWKSGKPWFTGNYTSNETRGIGELKAPKNHGWKSRIKVIKTLNRSTINELLDLFFFR